MEKLMDRHMILWVCICIVGALSPTTTATPATPTAATPSSPFAGGLGDLSSMLGRMGSTGTETQLQLGDVRFVADVSALLPVG